jgi:predicted lipoprotein with Yx(FWY)xxD motif
MKHWKMLLGATAMMATLAACGGNDSSSQDTSSSGSSTPAASGAAVSVKDVNGVGQALVDSAGKTVYFADQEASGKIACTGNCLSFWIPVPGSADAANSMAGLGTVKRSDTGMEQLTYMSKPLYTFKLDKGPAQSTGNNAQDSFGGTSFTWHAATASGAAAPAPAPSSSSSSNGGGYGY